MSGRCCCIQAGTDQVSVIASTDREVWWVCVCLCVCRVNILYFYFSWVFVVFVVVSSRLFFFVYIYLCVLEYVCLFLRICLCCRVFFWMCLCRFVCDSVDNGNCQVIVDDIHNSVDGAVLVAVCTRWDGLHTTKTHYQY